MPSKLAYLLNDSYNQRWIRKSNIRNYQAVPVDQFRNNSKSKQSAQPFIISWLKNLDRLVRLSEVDVKDFHFADIGCGSGVVCLYAGSRYPFKSVLGMDFEPDLIQKARDNLAGFRGRVKTKEIRFIEGDAAAFDLMPERCFLFLFNPFDADILKSFLNRNLKILSETKSVIAYTNDKHVEVFNDYHCRVSRDGRHNISLISF